MANFSKSIADEIRVLGPGYSNKWNQVLWGQFVWGAAADPQYQVFKYLFDTAAFVDSLTKTQNKVIGNSVATSDDTVESYVQDGSGYYREYQNLTTDLDTRVDTNWSESSQTAASWASSTGINTTWGASS